MDFVGKRRRGQLVSWVEKASLECIRQLLEITKVEHNHELLLSVKNLRELGASSFRYIVLVIPRSLLEELVSGEHFVLVDLLKSIPGSSSQVRFAKEPQAETTQETSATFTRPDQSPLDEQDFRPAPQAAKKKKKGKIITISVGLEGFVDWVDRNARDSAEKQEDDMSSLAVEFVARMRKRAASAHGETTLGFEVSGGKRPKRSSPDEEAQTSLVIISVDSPEQAFDALSALEGASQDASREACALLEDGVPTRGPPNADGVVGEAPSKIVVGPSFSARLSNVSPRRPRMPNRLMLSSYILPYEWDRPLADMVAPRPKAARKIMDHWSPFNKRESSVTCMRDLYPTLLRLPVVARAKEYYVPFPSYLDRKSFQRVVEDGMLLAFLIFNAICFILSKKGGK